MECGRRDRLLAQPQRRSLPHFRKRRRSAGPIAAECGQRASLVPLAPLPARRQALHFSRARRGRQNQRSLLGRSRNQDSDLLFASDSDAIYSGDLDGNPAKFGYLLFVQDGDLYTQGFNPSILEVEGKPELFLRHVGAVETLSLAPLSVSATGLLVYQTVNPPARQLVWMDRDGKQIGLLGEPADWVCRGSRRMADECSAANWRRTAIAGRCGCSMEKRCRVWFRFPEPMRVLRPGRPTVRGWPLPAIPALSTTLPEDAERARPGRAAVPQRVHEVSH